MSNSVSPKPSLPEILCAFMKPDPKRSFVFFLRSGPSVGSVLIVHKAGIRVVMDGIVDALP